MKKIDIVKYVSIGLSVLILALLFLGPATMTIRAVCCVLILVATLLPVASHHKSGYLFVFTFFIVSFAHGSVIDYPFRNFPAALITTVLIAFIFNFRTFFYRQMLISRAPWFEMAATLTVVAFFTVSAILVGYEWWQWVTASPIFLLAICTPLMYKDRYGIRKIMENKPIEMKIGTKAPGFTLSDQFGHATTLSELLKRNHILLIFVRGDWCPSCHIMLRSYFRNKEKFAERNVRLIGIGPDPQGVNKEMMQRIDEQSLMLSDPHQEITMLYASDLQATTVMNKTAVEKGIPLPAAFLVHQNGTIAHTTRSDRPGEILHPELIFGVLETFS
jgi:peroxiredoxin